MERLPVELRQGILSHLGLQEIRMVRLVSTSWARLGEDFLLDSTFKTSPFRDDFARLLDLSGHSRLSQKITSLNFNFGEMNDYHGLNNTIFIQYMVEPEERTATREEAWNEYRALRALKQEYEARYCNPELLSTALPRFNNVKSIKISLTECPFTQPLLQKVWSIPSSQQLSRVATTQRATTILQAAKDLQLESFSHDRLPFEFFGQRPAVLQPLFAPLNSLTHLSIYPDFSLFPNERHSDECFDGLGTCLRSSPHLQTLELGFQGNLLPIIKLEDCVGNFTWPELHTLELEGMTLMSTELLAFLSRFSTTLKQLRLGGKGNAAPKIKPATSLRLGDGTFEALLIGLRSNLSLEKFHLRGTVEEEVRMGRAVTIDPIYDDDWRELANVEITVGRELENFVVHNGDSNIFMSRVLG